MNDSNAETMYETVPLKFLRRTKDTLKLDLP